uniref:hypothetical protein n=1 Tax=Parafrankia discariae TaxID=365528 RepID=UPI0003A0E908|nr:hypothetical protein [Parafrankia discariae]
MISDRQLFLDVAASAAVLLRDPAVAASWETDSALTELRVGVLAAHAVHRHGPTAVLRAFSRAERAPATITAI